MFLTLALCFAFQEAPPEKIFEIEAGRKIPLTFLKSVSSKTAQPGDPIYLATLFPIMASGRVAIPPGAYVTGSVVEVKRAGKVKGRAELRVKLDTLILPDGTSRDFRGNLAGVDSTTGEVVDAEGKVQGRGGKMDDVKKIGTAAGAGAAVGAAAGALSTIGASNGDSVGDLNSVIRRPMVGSAIGLGAGAAGMFVASLFMRGPDAVIAKNTDVDMVLDVPLRFAESELAQGAVSIKQAPPADRTESGLIKRAPN
jgi:hypothetical protein